VRATDSGRATVRGRVLDQFVPGSDAVGFDVSVQRWTA
jgi:hypothetical protein